MFTGDKLTHVWERTGRRNKRRHNSSVLKRCVLLIRLLEKNDPSVEGERESRGLFRLLSLLRGVFIYPPCNLHKKTQPLRNGHIEDDTCGWLTTCLLAGLRSDYFIVSFFPGLFFNT